VLLESLDHQDQVDLRAVLVPWVELAKLVSQEDPGPKVPQDLLEILVTVDSLDHKDSLARLEILVAMVLLEALEQLVQLEILVSLGHRELQVQ